MPFPDDLSEILDRITNGAETEGDRQLLRQLLREKQGKNVLQLGKYSINLGQGREIYVGDRIYQGADAEAIQAAIRAVLQENRKTERSPEEKHLLAAVEHEVNARLKQSIHNTVLINLGKEQQFNQIKPLWSAELKTGSRGNTPLPASQKILEVFDQEDVAGRLLILGNPGSGKTTTMLELAKALIERAKQQPEFPIPVLLDLSTWQDTNQAISTWLVAGLKRKSYGVSIEVGQKWLKEHRLLPLLDGLDELKPDKQKEEIEKLNQFILSEDCPLYLVICSRRQDYELHTTKLLLNNAICLQSLSHTQIQSYLNHAGWEGLIQLIEDDPAFHQIATSPLFLNIITQSFQGISLEIWRQLSSAEKQINYLLDVYIQQELDRNIKYLWYKQKHEPNNHTTKHWLKWLARQMESCLKGDFFIEELQLVCLSTSSQRLAYKCLSTSIGGIIGGLQFGLAFNFVINPAIKVFLFLLGIICVGLSVGLPNKIEVIETLQFNFTNNQQRFKVGLRNGVSFGILFSITTILITGQYATGFKIGLMSGFCSGVVGWLNCGIRGPALNRKLVPNQGIRRALVNASLVGSITGIFLAILMGVSFGWNAGLSFGWFGFWSGVCIGGGTACLQHLCLRFVLWLCGSIPWNYARFLNYANERMFLQKVGGSYRFIHPLIQKHFSHLSE